MNFEKKNIYNSDFFFLITKISIQPKFYNTSFKNMKALYYIHILLFVFYIKSCMLREAIKRVHNIIQLTQYLHGRKYIIKWLIAH